MSKSARAERTNWFQGNRRLEDDFLSKKLRKVRIDSKDWDIMEGTIIFNGETGEEIDRFYQKYKEVKL